MSWLDKLVDWWNQNDERLFEDDVKQYVEKMYGVTEKDWNRLEEKDRQEWRDFYSKEMDR